MRTQRHKLGSNIKYDGKWHCLTHSYRQGRHASIVTQEHKNIQETAKGLLVHARTLLYTPSHKSCIYLTSAWNFPTCEGLWPHLPNLFHSFTSLFSYQCLPVSLLNLNVSSLNPLLSALSWFDIFYYFILCPPSFLPISPPFSNCPVLYAFLEKASLVFIYGTKYPFSFILYVNTLFSWL